MFALKMTKIGNSVGAVFPKEALAELGVDKGDVVYLTTSPDGAMRISRYNDEVAEEIATGKKFMARYRDTLRALAK
ncbi:MAG: AbrB/MazE/SpoVT family DNA-binding domain-containing protein [Caulobacter sp.]|nr:AbrB/MazE/SpoVT family DNA-binding domain-containing protein [Caulobacter sp.]